MSYKTSSTAFGTTGVKTITCGFQPIGIRITTGAAAGGPDGFMHYSIGRSDGTNQTCNWGFADNTLQDSDNYTDRLVSVQENSGGSLAEVMRANFNSFIATGFKINVATANANYDFFYEAWN